MLSILGEHRLERSGKRISIKDTRGIIDAILDGSIDKAPTKVMPYFDFVVPTDFRVLIRRSLTHATLTNVLVNGKKKQKIWLDVSSRTSLNLLVTKLVRLWLLLVRNSNWRIRYNMEGGSISNRLFYCYTVSFYEKEYCLLSFFSYICQNETIYF